MTGVEKCAVLLLSIGEHAAANVMKQLDETSVNRISTAMARVKRLDRGAVDDVLAEFLGRVDEQPARSVDSLSYVRGVLEEALGEKVASQVMEYVTRGDSMAATMDIVRGIDPAALAEQMRTERPQAIALLLAHLEPSAASDFLARLPRETTQEVLYRFARLDSVSPTILREMGGLLGEQLSMQLGTRQLSDMGGAQKAADILNNFPASDTQTLLDGISQRDGKLGEEIRESMFTFADLAKLDGRALQVLLHSIAGEQLVPALKAASAEVVEKLLSNVSERTAESVREDLASGPPVRRSDAERAQKEILRAARKLDAEGAITISAEEDLL